MNKKSVLCLSLTLTIIGCSKKDDTAAPAGAPSAQASPVAGSQVAGPSIPAVPSIPAIPAIPAMPAMPSAPAIPAMPSVPNQLALKTPDVTLPPAPAIATPSPGSGLNFPGISIPSAPAPAPVVTPTPAPAVTPAASSGSGGLKALAVSELTSDQVTGGLKEALGNGLQAAVSQLGKPGGFLNDPQVKIPMPDKLKSIESTLRAVGQGALADQFVTTMNQAAEQAVPAAAGVFVDALKNLTVADATNLLNGPDDAATQYFRKATESDLTAKFLPIVKQATSATGATADYKQIMDRAKAVSPFFSNPSLDLDSYVTGKAMDGLFTMVAAEEKNIRQNPVARSSDLLKSVFGALKK